MNQLPTIGAMANLLCAYDRSKTLKNKTELLRAIQNFKDVIQCPLEHILGNDFTLELQADEDNALQYLLRAIVDSMNGLRLESLSTPLCGPLRPLLKKVINILNILGIPSLNGRIQKIVWINGGKHLLGTLAVKSPGVLTQVLELLLGPVSTVRDVLGLLGGLGGAIGKTVGGLTNVVGDATGLLTDVTEGVGKVVGGLTSGLGVTGLLGSKTVGSRKYVKGLTPGLGPATGLLRGGTGGFRRTGGSISEFGGVPSLLGGLGDTSGVVTDLNRAGSNARLTGGIEVPSLLSGTGGRSGVVTDLNGPGSTTRLTSGIEGVTNIANAGGIGETVGALTRTLGGTTNALGGVSGLLELVPETSKTVSDTTGSVVKTVADGLIGPTGLLGTGLLNGLTETSNTGPPNTENVVNDNIFSSGVIIPHSNGIQQSGDVSGRYSANSDLRQGNGLLTTQGNVDAFGGPQSGLLSAVGDIVNGILGSSTTRKSTSLLGL
ncbi:uncharacterized protein [Engystomops pustulosus]